MTLQPVTFERFAGLDLRASPGANTAIDMSNVVVDANGESIRSRDGCAAFVGLAGTQILHITTWGGDTATRYMIAVSGAGQLAAVDGGGVGVATGTLAGAALSNVSSQMIGTPTASYVYLTSGSGWARFDGTAWTTPTMPAVVASARTVAVSPSDNRLAVGGTGNSFSRVQFSDPGAPETFGANNFVDVTPGDGEFIVAAATWHNLLFVFKQTKFFVFYGTSPNVDGSPIFNYRMVNTGIGCSHPNAVAVAPDGIYFLDRRGIFHTSGGPPQMISEPLDPFFRNQPHPYFAGGATYAPAQAGQGQMLTFAQGRLYCVLGTTGTPALKPFVWDQASNSWSLWALTIAGNGISTFGEARTQASQEGRVELVAGIGNTVYRFSPQLTTDNGQAINSNYRAAFTDLGVPSEKTVRGTIIDGSSSSGSVSWQWSREWGALQSTRSVSLGSSLGQGRDWYATRGRMLSWQVSGSSRWQLQRVEPLVRGSRPAGIKTAA